MVLSTKLILTFAWIALFILIKHFSALQTQKKKKLFNVKTKPVLIYWLLKHKWDDDGMRRAWMVMREKRKTRRKCSPDSLLKNHVLTCKQRRFSCIFHEEINMSMKTSQRWNRDVRNENENKIRFANLCVYFHRSLICDTTSLWLNNKLPMKS